MTSFRVTSESLPARCDICHQADCFDAATGACSRCAGLVLEVLSEPSVDPGIRPARPRRMLFQLMLSVFCLGASAAGVGKLLMMGNDPRQERERVVIVQSGTIWRPPVLNPSSEIEVPIPEEFSLFVDEPLDKGRLQVIKGKATRPAGSLQFGYVKEESFFGVLKKAGEWEIVYIPSEIREVLEPGQLSRLGLFLQIGLAGEPQIEVRGYRDRLSKRFYATKIRFPDRSKKSG